MEAETGVCSHFGATQAPFFGLQGVWDDGWRCFRITGQLDFSLIGILARISKLLASNEIGIFAISTYNTDYILTKEKNFEKALKVLKDAGYDIKGS